MLDKNVYFLGYLFFPQRSKLNFITYVTKLHSSECNVTVRYEIPKKLSMTLITKGSAIKDPTKLTKTKPHGNSNTAQRQKLPNTGPRPPQHAGCD